MKDLLAVCPLFAGLTPDEAEIFEPCTHRIKAAAGSLLMEAGKACEAIFYVLEGDVIVRVEDETSAPTMVEVLPAGSLVGWSALVPPHAATASLSCITDSVLLRLDGAELRRLCEAHPRAGYRVLLNLASVISDRLATARSRYAALLNRTKGQAHGGGVRPNDPVA